MLYLKGLRTLVDLRTRVGPMVSLVAGGTTDFTLNKRWDSHRNRNLANQHGNSWDVSARSNVVDSRKSFPQVRSGVSSHINDNYYQGQPQRKGINLAFVRRQSLKYVNNVSCVDQLCSVKLAPNVPKVAQNLPVGARLNQFWETWEALGAGLKVVQMLKKGYTLPFQTRPNLTRSSTIISCYVHPHRNLYLLEALHQLTKQKHSRVGQKSRITGFLQPAIFGPKPNNLY